MKRFFTDMNATLRGFLVIGLIALVVVVLSLQSVLATVGGLLRIAFFLAIAFFLFLLWREKRGDIETWSDRSRYVFYGAVVLAVIDIGALIAAVVVVLSLQSVLATVGGLLQIGFFLAIAFFLFLLWREKRGDIESWQDRSRYVFYAAIVLAVVDVGAFIGLRPSGLDALVFFLVLGACAYAVFRVWRQEHTYR